MNLDTYMKDLDPTEKRDFARRVDRSYNYLRHIAKGRKLAGAKLARAIERESGGAVPKAELRSDYFGAVA